MPPDALRRSVPREEKRSAKELMACVLREWTLAILLPRMCRRHRLRCAYPPRNPPERAARKYL